MAGVTITTEIEGVSQVLTKFANLDEALKSFESATSKIGELLKNFFTEEVYASQGAVYGSPWAALSEPYATKKLERYGSSTILIASGTMKSSYTLYSGPMYILLQNEARNKKGDYYAKFHQRGTKKMPQRTLMKMDDIRKRQVNELLRDAVNEKVASA